ncbi:MAG: hypothetical protein O7J95_06385, partial [Planctomycetota bacterium]|nr:hypothetical protein [Planctomycetota bacterium]
PLGALALGVWSLFHPLVETLVHGTGGWSSLLGEAVKSAVTALNPFFLLGLLGGTVVLYGLSALCLWLRELQVLDAGIVRAERALHSEVRRRGHAVIDELRERVSSFRQDFETLEEVLSDVLPPASPRRDATGPGLRGAPPS